MIDLDLKSWSDNEVLSVDKEFLICFDIPKNFSL